MGITDYLTCLLRNLHVGQIATVRTRYGITDCFQTEKEVRPGFTLSPCLFNFYAEYIMWNAGLDEAQTGIKTVGRNISNLRYADDTIFMAESEEKLKSLLMKVKEESEEASLKLNIQKMKIMASGPITSWQINGETMEIVTDFIFLGYKITETGDCSHQIKRRLLLGKKKQRHYFPDKGSYSQSYSFSSSHVQMWQLDNKKGGARKNWCPRTVVLEKTPLNSKEIKPINPEENQPLLFTGRTDPEALIFSHLLRRADSLEKTLMLGKTEDRRKRR